MDDSLFVWQSEVPSQSIKNYHKGVIEKSIQSLFTDPIDSRSFSSVVMPIDESKLVEAKKMIQDFTFKLNKFLTKGKNKSRIYYYSNQLFPVDKNNSPSDPTTAA